MPSSNGDVPILNNLKQRIRKSTRAPVYIEKIAWLGTSHPIHLHLTLFICIIINNGVGPDAHYWKLKNEEYWIIPRLLKYEIAFNKLWILPMCI